MTLATLSALCLARGFVPEPQEPHFGAVLADFAYLRRGLTYLNLIAYESCVCEVVWETYLAPKSTRTPKGRDTTTKGAKHSDFQMRGFTPIAAGIVRTDAEIANLLDTMAHSGESQA